MQRHIAFGVAGKTKEGIKMLRILHFEDLSVGMTEEAQRMASILGYNFPGSEWYQRTYALMTEEGVAPVAVEEAERRGWLRRTFGRVL